jgi:hypothetical protein
MAKELPYYQFEVAEYLAGDIMICSLEAQGLFSIIKCLYWQKECILSVKQVLKRFDKQDLIDELIEEGCLKVENGNIIISFLMEQFIFFKERRDKLSEAGRRGGLNKKEASLKPPLSEAKATLKHIEESRVDESIEEENRIKENNIDRRKQKFASTLNPFLEKYGKEFLNNFFKYWTEPNKSNSKFRQELEKTWSLERRLENWAKNEKNFKTNNKLQTTTADDNR